jgi:hypothetical protein
MKILLIALAAFALLGANSCESDDDQGVESPTVTYTICYLGDQILTIDAAGNVVATRPIDETAVEAEAESAPTVADAPTAAPIVPVVARLLVTKQSAGLPPLIAQCGADVVINWNDSSTTTIDAGEGSVAVEQLP